MIICNLSPDFDHDGISDKAGKHGQIYPSKVGYILDNVKNNNVSE